MRRERNTTAGSGGARGARSCGPPCGFARPARSRPCRPSRTSPVCGWAALGAARACATERPGAG
eukprot:5889435-Lingulodinium_polyedra.AAC.1